MALDQDMLKQPCRRCMHAYDFHDRHGCGACSHCPSFERAPQPADPQLRIAVVLERIAAALEDQARAQWARAAMERVRLHVERREAIRAAGFTRIEGVFDLVAAKEVEIVSATNGGDADAR